MSVREQEKERRLSDAARWAQLIRAEAQRDELLRALKLLRQETRTPATRDDNPYMWHVLDQVDAALTKATENR